MGGRIENPTPLPQAAPKAVKSARNLVLKRKPDLKGVAVARKRAQEQLADELIQTRLTEATGNQPDEVADRLISQVGNAQVWPKPNNLDEHVIKAITTMVGMAPQNLTEAMLAVQMIAANDAALMFLHRATLENQCTQAVDANVLRASRLMRLFNEQLEAMQKLKGKAGQQKVTVEHVHVHEGGQAIVGAVTTHGGRGGGGNAENRDNTP